MANLRISELNMGNMRVHSNPLIQQETKLLESHVLYYVNCLVNSLDQRHVPIGAHIGYTSCVSRQIPFQTCLYPMTPISLIFLIPDYSLFGTQTSLLFYIFCYPMTPCLIILRQVAVEFNIKRYQGFLFYFTVSYELLRQFIQSIV